MSFIFTFKRAISDTALYKEQVKNVYIESKYRHSTVIEWKARDRIKIGPFINV